MSMDMISEIDKSYPMPLYFQLKELLKKRIITKEWKPGSKISTELEICEFYDVSRITVRKALEELQQEGYLEKKQGKGTFVSDQSIEQKLSKFYSFSEELKKKGLIEKTQMAEFDTVTVEEEIAEQLKLAPGEKVHLICRIRVVDNQPYAYERSYIPFTLAPELTAEMVSGQGLYKSLAKFGLMVDNATEKFRAENMDEEIAGYLGVAPGAAAILLQRVACSGTLTVEYCESHVVGDFFSYTVELR